MKPRNKFEKECSNIHLPQMTVPQKKEAIALFKHQAIRTKTRGTTCLECGCTFDLRQDNSLLVHSIQTSCKCPECKSKLEIIDTRKRQFFSADLFSVHIIHNGMQVLRYFEITQKYVYSQPVQYRFVEVVRVFITPQGKHALLARLSNQSYYANTYFHLESQLEIRQLDDKYAIKCDTWSGSKLIPEIYRNGFSGDLRKYYEAKLFITLLSNNIMETFWKTNQMEMFDIFYKDQKGLNTVWPAIKICNRHNYKIKDWYNWVDYIKMLVWFKKDITNPYYVCPKDLKFSHDRYLAKKKKIEAQISIQRRLELIEKENAKYIVDKKKYLDIEIKDNDLVITTIQSVHDFYTLGEIMHHCIYSMKYYEKKESLIFQAYINEYPLETVEVSLPEMKILQCRGKLNQDTKYHKTIIDLVNNHFKQQKNDFKRSTRKSRQIA